MPATARVDPDTGIAYCSATGELTRDEILAVIEQVYRDPNYRESRRTIWNLVEATPAVSAEDLRAVVDYVKAHRPAGAGKTAIVAAKDLAYGLSRMYEVMTGEQPFETRVFRDSELAHQWLLEDEPEAR